MVSRQEVWIRAFCAYGSSFNARSESSIHAADACLKAFDERFPVTGCETQFCGVPLSELSDEQRAVYKQWVMEL